MILLQDGYWPEKPISEAPVWLQISVDDEGTPLHGGGKEFGYRIEVRLADFRGVALCESGSVEEPTAERAKERVLFKAIDALSQLLAARVRERVS